MTYGKKELKLNTPYKGKYLKPHISIFVMIFSELVAGRGGFEPPEV